MHGGHQRHGFKSTARTFGVTWYRAMRALAVSMHLSRPRLRAGRGERVSGGESEKARRQSRNCSSAPFLLHDRVLADVVRHRRAHVALRAETASGEQDGSARGGAGRRRRGSSRGAQLVHVR